MGLKLTYMNSRDHDKHIAYVSHLSHISSFMLGKTVIDKEKNEKNIFDMAGSGLNQLFDLQKVHQIHGRLFLSKIKRMSLKLWKSTSKSY